MKTTGIILIISMLSLGLSSCLTSSKTYQQITSTNVDCKTKEIQILDEKSDLNSTESWTAKCQGKTYRCSYHSSAGSDCNEIPE